MGGGARTRSAVTGALSYTGRYLARLLLDAGHTVVNLSNRPHPIAVSPLRSHEVGAMPRFALDFHHDSMARALEGCDVLYCTYWVRFVGRGKGGGGGGGDAHQDAVDRLDGLFRTAREVGVRKVVFVSHTWAREDSPFPYIAGKARAVAALRAAGLPDFAVVRPNGVFGDTAFESVLLNNAAWVVRRCPVVLLPGDGSHAFQPIHVRDMARLMFDLGTGRDAATFRAEKDACGPDAVPVAALFNAIAEACGARSAVVASRLPTAVVTALTQPINWATGDVLLDKDDLDLLCSGLTVAEVPDDPLIAPRRSVLAWVREHGAELGREYVSSVARYYAHNNPS